MAVHPGHEQKNAHKEWEPFLSFPSNHLKLGFQYYKVYFLCFIDKGQPDFLNPQPSELQRWAPFAHLLKYHGLFVYYSTSPCHVLFFLSLVLISMHSLSWLILFDPFPWAWIYIYEYQRFRRKENICKSKIPRSVD